MTSTWRCWGWKLGIASSLAMGGAIAASGNCALAQIAPDGTLGAESSVVAPLAPGSTVDVIEGGATRGANLFHSFEKFSVPTGGAAYFNNALDIQNILSRVTGSSVSNIDGLIAAKGTANLFLLNPNGIIFGPNASLSIGGSFLASTASAVNFADGTQFSATAHPTTPLLTVSVPIGLQYGGTTGGIQVQQSILQVQTGQTLALIGGNVSVEGGESGFLSAPGGRVELGGLVGAGVVEIEGQQSDGVFGLSFLSFPDAVERADVLLTNLAYVEVAAFGGGSIAINARNIDISGDSKLSGGLETDSGFKGATAGDITLNATGAIAIANSYIFNNVRTGAVGNGGSINIMTGSLEVTNGAQLQALTRGQGNGGSVTINARDTVAFDGVGSNGFVSGVFSVGSTDAVGNGGSVNITTGSLSVTNGAQLAVSTRGQGDAGSVTIRATDTISFDDARAFSTVEATAAGNAGSIDIITESLAVTNGAQLAASTRGRGNAGSVIIRATDTISFDGVGSDGLSSGAFSTVEETGAVGNGGSIDITTGSLAVTNGAQLVANTRGQGNAGSVMIRATDTISFSGVGSNGLSSAAFSTVGAAGAVGNGRGIDITTGSLTVTNGAQLLASTFGQGDAGSVTITATNTVFFDGVGSNGLSSGALSAVKHGAVGSGGSIDITTGSLTITNGAGLTASSEGNGVAGNIDVAADSIRLDDQAFLSSDTTAGQGNIILSSGDLVLRYGSNITTNATGAATGGNITIDTGVLAALENSDIRANAEESFGGLIIINAQGIFGTEFRHQQTPESDITASSNLGPEFSGTVEINTPDVDPAQGLVNLPAQLVDASGLIAQTCPGGGGQGQSEFIVTGRGGLPPNSSEALSSETVQVDWVTLNPKVENRSSSDVSTNLTSPTPAHLVEAQGWVINAKGEVVLTAQAPTITPHGSWQTPTSCHTPKSAPGN